jgi:hypothetical protein
MSQRVWLVSVMAVAFGVVGITAERSSSQETSQEGPQAEGSQPQAEASGEFGRGFGRVGGSGGEFRGGRWGEFGGSGRGGFGGEIVADTPHETSESKHLPVPAVPRIWVVEDSEETERLYELLKNEVVTTLQFPEGTPLNEVLVFLSEECNVQIQLDTIALDELGIAPDEPTVLSVENARLSQAMRLLLDPLELTCIVYSGGLLVTSPEESLNKQPVALYDVRDLLLKGSYEGLIDTITMTIAPDTWAANGGGDADIRAYPQRGALVIKQSSEVHADLASFFGAMRQLEAIPSAKPTVIDKTARQRKIEESLQPRGIGSAGGVSDYEDLVEALRHLDEEKNLRQKAGDDTSDSHLSKAYGLIYNEANRRGAGIFSISETPVADTNNLNDSE